MSRHYKSVAAGLLHTCAIQTTAGLMDCWGDNLEFQLSTTDPTVLPSGGLFFLTMNPKHALLTNKGASFGAAGDTHTCAQNSDEDTICWGTPAPSTGNAGFIALHNSYARSMATDSDTCFLGTVAVSCTRTCVTGLSGDMFCGQWSAFGNPPPLSKVPAPAIDQFVSYNQLDVGPNHVCAVTSHRDIFCFWLNTRGQFGTGALSSTRTSVPVTAANR
jgi:alpha-tubulin suppressor-like RCC1 family protein